MNSDTGKAYMGDEEIRKAFGRGENLIPVPEPVARAIISIRHEQARRKRERRRRRSRRP